MFLMDIIDDSGILLDRTNLCTVLSTHEQEYGAPR